ncbi:glycerol-3-phosphate acyltransferase [Patescibacteria group bacterium]|nr:glycerol-3-phosphate acyltransferase [Patescibacteria group bacterium]MBU4022784.1 glycerol-3-phosphate acyltransferase [Patescibacteria group bacterium]
MPEWIVAISFISYLLGSIPFSYIVAKSYGKNLHKEGSGNVGAMNVWRSTRKFWPLFSAFTGDVGKGSIAMAIATIFSNWHNASPLLTTWALAFACAFVVIGHNWPIWLNFKGGKGLACLLGVVLFLNLGAGFAALGVIIAAIFLTEFVMTSMEFKKSIPRKAGAKGFFKKAFSVLGAQVLGRVIGIALTPAMMWFFFGQRVFWIALAGVVIALFKHMPRLNRYLRDLTKDFSAADIN